jgi:hypothetical protein
LVYMLGESYFKNNDLMNRALNIGLETLKNNGEI